MTQIRTTADITAVRRRLYQPLWDAVGVNGELVGSVINTVASHEDADLDLVVASMWDLVEEGKLVYGTDAKVRRVSASNS